MFKPVASYFEIQNSLEFNTYKKVDKFECINVLNAMR